MQNLIVLNGDPASNGHLTMVRIDRSCFGVSGLLLRDLA